MVHLANNVGVALLARYMQLRVSRSVAYSYTVTDSNSTRAAGAGLNTVNSQSKDHLCESPSRRELS